MDTARAFADEMVHIVISEDGLSEHLALNGAIARVPHGTVMRISFDYSEYHELHPYLIANQFCDDRQFLRWGQPRIRLWETLTWSASDGLCQNQCPHQDSPPVTDRRPSLTAIGSF